MRRGVRVVVVVVLVGFIRRSLWGGLLGDIWRLLGILGRVLRWLMGEVFFFDLFFLVGIFFAGDFLGEEDFLGEAFLVGFFFFEIPSSSSISSARRFKCWMSTPGLHPQCLARTRNARVTGRRLGKPAAMTRLRASL